MELAACWRWWAPACFCPLPDQGVAERGAQRHPVRILKGSNAPLAYAWCFSPAAHGFCSSYAMELRWPPSAYEETGRMSSDKGEQARNTDDREGR